MSSLLLMSGGGSGSGSSTLAALTDVNITSIADKQHLVYDAGSSKWLNHTLVAGDIPNIAESQVTNLVSDLSLKAPLASPALTGNPTAPTQAAGTNNTTLATTAYVDAEASVVGMNGFFSNPNIDGAGVATAATGWNGGWFVRFFLPQATTVTKVTINVVAVSASGSKTAAFGIYPASAGSSLLAGASFNVSTGQATGVRSASITQTSVRLARGWYYAVTTSNATDVSLSFFQQPTTATINIMNNASQKRAGTVTMGAAGTLDSTLGTLAASVNVAGGVAAFWEP